MLNVLVTGVGSLIGEGIIRALKSSKLDCKIVGTDYFAHAAGLYWVAKGYLLPDFLKKDVSEENWLNAVIKIIQEEGIDVVLIGLDFEVELFAKYKAVIEGQTKAKVVVGDPKTVAICKDKWETVNFLRTHHFPFAPSCLPENRGDFLKNHDFPFVVKPRFGFRSQNFSVVNNAQELDAALKLCPQPFIQKQVGIQSQEYTCGAILFEGKIISNIALRRDLKDGNTWRAYWDQECCELNNFIEQVALTLKLFGPANFQLRKTDGGPVIFEINPRFSGTTPIRAMFGLNEVEILLKALMRGEYPNETPQLSPGVALRYFDEIYVSEKQFSQWGKP